MSSARGTRRNEKGPLLKGLNKKITCFIKISNIKSTVDIKGKSTKDISNTQS